MWDALIIVASTPAIARRRKRYLPTGCISGTPEAGSEPPLLNHEFQGERLLTER